MRKILPILLAASAFAVPALAATHPFVNGLHQISHLASTVPPSGAAKGDQNPYGVAVVPKTTGKLTKGDVLVSNFNNGQNQQGTGSSIVEISPGGGFSVFALVPQPTSTPAVGLTTALVALRSGFVVVGSLPAPGGMSSAAHAGALTILNSAGHVVGTITGHGINGPWDMTAVEHGSTVTLFVTNVLNGTVAAAGKVVHKGTVVRLRLQLRKNHPPKLSSSQVIAKGFAEHTDPNALVVGPTGVGLGRSGALYVADSNGNRVAAIPNAMTRSSALGGGGQTVSSGSALNDPLGLAIAPNGDIITANGADGNLVETTPSGTQAAVKMLIAMGGGDLFGIARAPHHGGLYFVNDAGGVNDLELLH